MISGILCIIIGLAISIPLTFYIKAKCYNKTKLPKIEGLVIGHIDEDNCYHVKFSYSLNGIITEGKSDMGSSGFLKKYPRDTIVTLGISPDGKSADIIDESYFYLHWLVFVFGLVFIISGISMISQDM